MSATYLLRSHVKYMVDCLYRHSCMLNTIPGPSFRAKQVCQLIANSHKNTLCSDQQFYVLRNYMGIRTRSLCSDAIPTGEVEQKQKVPQEETKQYLTLLGLDCDLIQDDQPSVLREDVSKAKELVAFLQSLHLTDQEILDILKKTPQLLKVDTSSIKEHIQFLQDLELEGLLILNIFQRVPKFFATPLPRIKDNVEYAQSLNLTNKNMRLLMKYAPSLFYRRKNGVKNLAECVTHILLEHDPKCVPETSLRYMIRNDPLLFGRSVGEIKHRVEHLISLGFNGEPLAKIIRFCPSVLRIGTEFITERLELLQKHLSLSYDEALDMVIRLPKILHASNETIETKVDLLYKKGFTAADIQRAPRVFSCSLQRIESRLDKLSELKHPVTSLNILQKSEAGFEDFIEKLRHKQQMKEDELNLRSEKSSPQQKQ